MGLDALVASLSTQRPPSHTRFENLLFHLRTKAKPDEQPTPKEAIRTLRDAMRDGTYRGSARDAFAELGEHLDRIDTGCDTRHRGMLHAYHDYAQIGIQAGLEAYRQGDEDSARYHLEEARDVEQNVAKQYDEGMLVGFTERFSFRAYVERSFIHASVLLEAIDDETYRLPRGGAERIVTDYVRKKGVTSEIAASIEKGRNLAAASRLGPRLGAYHELKRLSKVSFVR